MNKEEKIQLLLEKVKIQNRALLKYASKKDSIKDKWKNRFFFYELANFIGKVESLEILDVDVTEFEWSRNIFSPDKFSENG